MTRAEYILAHAPTILGGLLARADEFEKSDESLELAVTLAGRLWDEVDPTRQTRSVKDEVGYKTAVEDCIKLTEDQLKLWLDENGRSAMRIMVNKFRELLI